MASRTAGVAAVAMAAAASVVGPGVIPPALASTPVANPAWGWGGNYWGSCGDGTTVDRAVPVRVSGTLPYRLVAAGGYFSLAVTAEGEVRAWGANYNGQLGDATTTSRTTPVAVGWVSDVRSVDGGDGHSLAANGDGTVWTWGSNRWGELGDGSPVEYRSIPGPVPGLSGVVEVTGGYLFSLARTESGEVWGWGVNWWGNLGIGVEDEGGFRPPVQAATPPGVKAVSAGGGFALAIAGDGTLWGWGLNYSGAVGNGSRDSVATPERLGGMRDVVDVAAGYSHSLALTADGQVWQWGTGDSWEPEHDRLRPEAVAGLSDVIDVAAGDRLSLAVRSDGTVWAWGSNYYGQLGNDSFVETHTPVRVTGLTGASSVAAGYNHSLALAIDQEAPLPIDSVGLAALGGFIGLALALRLTHGRHGTGHRTCRLSE